MQYTFNYVLELFRIAYSTVLRHIMLKPNMMNRQEAPKKVWKTCWTWWWLTIDLTWLSWKFVKMHYFKSSPPCSWNTFRQYNSRLNVYSRLVYFSTEFFPSSMCFNGFVLMLKGGGITTHHSRTSVVIHTRHTFQLTKQNVVVDH